MFKDIKFNGPVPLDANGEELEIGDVVFTYAGWTKSTVAMTVVAQTKSNKYIWVTDGEHLYKRMPKNTILIRYPDKIWISNKHRNR